MSDHARWMTRALELARRGEAQASPNPLVGAVVVRSGQVVGEGFHLYARKDHAEIVALRRAGARARGATLYVNLEPCCHTGRTGPCTDAILSAGVRRVVAAMRDPNPAVSGRGLAQLRRAGVEVICGVSEEEARWLNAPFARWIRTGLPLVTMKSAISADGKIAPPPHRLNPRTRWISSPPARAAVQRMRHAADALLTGIGTLLADDPLLTDRSGLPRRRPLLRVVLDSWLRLPLESRVVRSAREDVLVFTAQPLDTTRARALRRAGVDVVHITGAGNRPALRAVLAELGRLNVQHVLLEAGTALSTAAIRSGIVDRLALFISRKELGPQAVPLFAAARSPLSLRLRNAHTSFVGSDLLVEGELSRVHRNHSSPGDS